MFDSCGACRFSCLSDMGDMVLRCVNEIQSTVCKPVCFIDVMPADIGDMASECKWFLDQWLSCAV